MSVPRPGSQTARVGFLVFVALAILIANIMSLGGEQKFWERKVQYEVHFARTNGLQVGAPVSLTGVTIGSVAEMRFPPDPTASYIQVLVNVLGEATPRIHDNSVATIRTFGLLGDRYIELSSGSPDAAPLPPGSLISSIDPVDYEAVLGQSGDIVTNVVEVTASLRVVLQALARGEGLLGAMVRNRERGRARRVARRHRPPELAPRRVQGGIGALALRRRDRRNAATGPRQANARRPLTADRSAWTSGEAHALTITVRRRVPVLLAVCVPSLVA